MAKGKKFGWWGAVVVVCVIAAKVAIRAPRLLQRAQARTDPPAASVDTSSPIAVIPQTPTPASVPAPAPATNPSNDAAKPLEFAEQLMRKQRWADALIALEAIRASHVSDARYWVLVGDCNQRGTGNVALAEEAYRKAITLDPKSLRASDGLANVLADRGRQADALAVYRQLARELPTSPHPYRAAARLAMKAGNRAQALTLIEKGFGLIDQPVASDYVARGQARAMVNKDADAMADFQSALKLDPRSVAARMGVADLHLKARRLKEAKAAYAALLEPPLSHAYLQLGRIARMEGDFTAARRYWSHASTAEPNSDAASAARRHLAELDAAKAGITKSR